MGYGIFLLCYRESSVFFSRSLCAALGAGSIQNAAATFQFKVVAFHQMAAEFIHKTTVQMIDLATFHAFQMQMFLAVSERLRPHTDKLPFRLCQPHTSSHGFLLPACLNSDRLWWGWWADRIPPDIAGCLLLIQHGCGFAEDIRE